MEKRYGTLRFIGTMYKVFGVIIAVLTVLGTLFAMFGGAFIDFGFGVRGGTGAVLVGIVVGIVYLIIGLIGSVVVYSVGELVYLLINIEENTRFSAIVLRDRLAAPQPVQQPVMPPMPPVQPPMPPVEQAPEPQPPQY